MAPRQQNGKQCIAHHGWHCDVLFCPHCPHSQSAVLWHSGQTCRRCSGVAHPCSQYLRQQQNSPDGDLVGPRSASPQHEVEQSRGPGHGHGWRAQTRGGDGEQPSSMETERECWRRGTSMSSKLCQSGLDAERDRAAMVGRCSGGSTGVTCQHSPH